MEEGLVGEMRIVFVLQRVTNHAIFRHFLFSPLNQLPVIES